MNTNNGWKLVRVNEAFSDLMFWLERCSERGHLDNCYDLVAPWEAFKYEYADDDSLDTAPDFPKATACTEERPCLPCYLDQGECTAPPASAQDAITVSLDPDPRGVSVGVWQGSCCIYNGAHPLPASAQDDAKDEQTESILWWIMRQAQEAKEPCGDDPESPAAIRNAKLAGIGGAAAQALGLVRGPDYPSPAAGNARDALQYLADTEGAVESLTLGGKTRYRVWWPAVGEIQTEWFDSPLAAIAASQQQEG